MIKHHRFVISKVVQYFQSCRSLARFRVIPIIILVIYRNCNVYISVGHTFRRKNIFYIFVCKKSLIPTKIHLRILIQLFIVLSKRILGCTISTKIQSVTNLHTVWGDFINMWSICKARICHPIIPAHVNMTTHQILGMKIYRQITTYLRHTVVYNCNRRIITPLR